MLNLRNAEETSKLLFKNAPRLVNYDRDVAPAVKAALGQLAVRRL